MDASDEARLVELIDVLVREEKALPRLPGAVFEIIGHLVPLIAVEVGITRAGGEILLTHRCDHHWNGWHLPGGFLGVRETLAAACNRIAQRELAIEVSLQRVVDTFCWPDHPQGSVLSMVCQCKARGFPGAGRWFKGPNEPMIRYHADFAIRCLKSSSALIPS